MTHNLHERSRMLHVSLRRRIACSCWKGTRLGEVHIPRQCIGVHSSGQSYRFIHTILPRWYAFRQFALEVPDLAVKVLQYLGVRRIMCLEYTCHSSQQLE